LSPAILELGGRLYDITHRALVMGILNRTPDSFYDKGAYFDMASFIDRAAGLVDDRADLFDVGGVKAGPGPEVGLEEELERVVPAVEALKARFEIPISVDTWNADVAEAAYRAGAVVGNDISGFSDPRYLKVAAEAGAAVVATHIRLAPRIPDPEPVYADLVGEVNDFLRIRAEAALDTGIPARRVMVDAGHDLGKTWLQSLDLLRATDELAALGFPVLLSVSNKTFLGRLLGQEVDRRRESSLAATALGIALGARVLRVHDVKGTARVRDTMEALLRSGAG
jgi:dihydropteroate synthase